MDAATVLKQARRRSGLTQAGLARAAGTSQPVISAYEHGHRDPTLGTLERLLRASGHELRVEARALDVHDLPPPRNLREHGQRLVELLGLADAIPRPPTRSEHLEAPRMVSISSSG